jgi:hypothetical protein
MKKLCILGVLLLLSVMVRLPSASATTIGFSNGGTINATVGGTYSVDVVISGMPSGQVVSAFDLDVLFNKNILSVNSVVFSPWLGSLDPLLFEVLTNAILTKSGVANFASVSMLSDLELKTLQSSLNGTVTLATLNFGAIATGSSTLTFDWYPTKDVKGVDAKVIYGYGADPAVPEPGTILLLGSGVAYLFRLRRRA